MSKTKVLVAMSGGVDSSVAAALLLQAGYDVTGAFMINYESGRAPVGDESCWLPEYRDALRVAAKLGIPLLKLDFTTEYKENVLDYMYREYQKGRTPNPDVLCNTFIKFGVWLEYARAHGFDFLATGHYAGLQQSDFRLRPLAEDRRPKTEVHLLEAKDKNKDQTYFLHQLNQRQLFHTLFPIGHLLKTEVRSLARKLQLPTAAKEESMGICFVGEVPMKEFLQKNIKPKPGKIVLTNGEVIGQHDGLPFYTMGQRHKIGLQQSDSGLQQKNKSRRPKTEDRSRGMQPLFVVEKRMNTNELVVGYEDDPLLYQKKVILKDVHWTLGQSQMLPLQCEVRLRHRQPLQKAKVQSKKGKEVVIEFDTPQRAVTPGQFAVFYLRGECLGGGVVV